MKLYSGLIKVVLLISCAYYGGDPIFKAYAEGGESSRRRPLTFEEISYEQTLLRSPNGIFCDHLNLTIARERSGNVSYLKVAAYRAIPCSERDVPLFLDQVFTSDDADFEIPTSDANAVLVSRDGHWTLSIDTFDGGSKFEFINQKGLSYTYYLGRPTYKPDADLTNHIYTTVRKTLGHERPSRAGQFSRLLALWCVQDVTTAKSTCRLFGLPKVSPPSLSASSAEILFGEIGQQLQLVTVDSNVLLNFRYYKPGQANASVKLFPFDRELN